MHRRLITIAVSAAVVAGVLVASGATAAPKEAKTGFRQVLAAKLGAQLDRPAGDVLAALKAARQKGAERPARGNRPNKGERREQAAAKRKAWTEAMASALRVEPAAVTAAVRALVKERLDSLVEDGWLTAEQRDKRLRNAGIRMLRVR